MRKVYTMGKKLIDFIDITKSYNGNVVLDDLNLYIRENEFLTLLGPSGCGKTTTLRMLGGFETPDKGKIMFDSKDITNVPANERNLNTVFQKYSLFPHMTIAENIAFGLKIKKKSKAYIDDKIKYALKLVNLDGFENRSVDSLSGGQQQRIAIARAIVNEPKVLLLDEPLGALDLKLRQSMQYELIRFKNELGITFVYVTHDQEEALTMSDTIVVMNQGYIQQIGTPEDIYNEPENAFVADFIGLSNIIDGVMIKDKLVEIIGVKMPCVDEGFGENTPVDIVIRPEDVELVPAEDGYMQGDVVSNIFKGVHYELEVKANGYDWMVHTTKYVEVGSHVGDIYQDNGEKETNFDRLEFKRMMDMTALLLMIPLKNMINDVYAKDISRKIITSFRARQEKGEFLPAFVPVPKSRLEKADAAEDDLNDVVWATLRKLLEMTDVLKCKLDKQKSEQANDNFILARKLSELQRDKEKCESDRFANVD